MDVTNILTFAPIVFSAVGVKAAEMTKCVAYQFDFLRFPTLVGSYQHHQGIKQTSVCPTNSEPPK